ncbi:hypothetical protein ABZ571_30530, partial [Streptomyces sp. NPDC013130]|uniref:hypothetical protein n=1 Tax=Streptomyces sp. NPDC013130 TaxID=3156695 RepID=UPI0033D4E2C3
HAGVDPGRRVPYVLGDVLHALVDLDLCDGLGQDARCAAAHAWVGLGRIVYVASSRQLSQWLADWGVPPPPVRALPINEVAPGVPADGPVPELVDEVRELHHRLHHGDAH